LLQNFFTTIKSVLQYFENGIMFTKTEFNKFILHSKFMTTSVTETVQLYPMKMNCHLTLDRRKSNFDCMLPITVADTCFLNARSNNG